jgi:hypothetical protein
MVQNLRQLLQKKNQTRSARLAALSAWVGIALLGLGAAATRAVAQTTPAQPPGLPKIRLPADGRTFAVENGRPFVPLGVTYYRPGTGWAPQVWKKFDADATRQDFARMKELGVNCVRVFLSYGSFCTEPGVLVPNGLAKFDQFLALAEAAGIYVHPTGPDHWEGVPAWAQGDRFADEKILEGLESFWRLFAGRYRGRPVIFAYDLLNEPEVRWDTPVMRGKWSQWLETKYGSIEKLTAAWGSTNLTLQLGRIPVPPAKEAPGSPELLDYQRFREDIADQWTRRQVSAIKSADPQALVTVGLIQWSVPALIAHPGHYSAFRPARQAKLLDFLEIHFYPLDHGAYEYRDAESEQRNLAYLEGVVREAARPGKPLVLAEFGWYGGGKPMFDQGRHPFASEEQQAQWCRRLVETTQGLATGWLNWGFYDQPEATDCSQLTGLLTPEGKLKAWGREFQKLSASLANKKILPATPTPRPSLDWEGAVTSPQIGNRFRDEYYRAFRAAQGPSR